MRYRPVSARYKVYIIDEVHMLSKNAFNALLKTLEEPPPDVKFVFATTEIHKVPVTVLSRCQRFSLRRVPVEQLIQHYRRIAEAEGVEVEPAALGADRPRRRRLGARRAVAARPGDRAFGDGARIEEAAVRDMLGIADRGLVFDLLETRAARRRRRRARRRWTRLYQGGADPLIVLQDLLDLSHFVTRLKLAPEAGTGDPIEEGDRERARPLADALSMPVLARAWQMLLKGLEEVQAAPSPTQAAEMVLVRLAYVADLPVPAELVRALMAQAPESAPPRQRPDQPGNAARQPALPRRRRGPGEGAIRSSRRPLARLARPGEPPRPRAVTARAGVRGRAATRPAPTRPTAPRSTRRRKVLPRSSRCSTSGARRCCARISGRTFISSRSSRAGSSSGPAEGAPRDLANRLGQLLGEWTGMRWLVAVSQAAGEPTLASRRRSGTASCGTRWRPPVGPGGARDFPGGDDRGGAGAVRGGRSRRRRRAERCRGRFGEDGADTGEDGA